MTHDPDAFLTEAFEKLRCFNTSLFGCKGGRTNYCGSGSLVNWGKRRCLLTAGHVWEALKAFDEVAVSSHGGRRIASFRHADYLKCLYCSPRPGDRWGPWGPDLALIEVLGKVADTLHSHGKGFYDLTRRRAEALAEQPDPAGIWAVIGTPEEFVASHADISEAALTHFELGLSLIVAAKPRLLVHDDFDYVELPLNDKRTQNFPAAYKGISGSGLWRLGRAEGSLVTWDDRVSLEGVAYWHDPGSTPETECIRCHGRHSIYRNLLDEVPED